MSEPASLILRITTDQHSPMVTGFGGDPYVRTPKLDRLAAGGTVYANHYCANPICVPGRYSMMTGQLPRELGTCHFWDILPSDVPTYASILGDSGYQTTCAGKMHFHGIDQMHGWHHRPYGDMEMLNRSGLPGYDGGKDRFRNWKKPFYIFDDHGGYNPAMLKHSRPGHDKYMLFDESVTRESGIHLTDFYRATISEGADYQGTRPLLFESSFKTPHCPFVCPPELFEYYMDILPLPEKKRETGVPDHIRARQQQDQPDWVSEEMIRRSRAGYWGLVEWVDQQIGCLLQVVEDLGLMDETAILYTSDHGEMAGERGLWQKAVFYEESVRVPTILAGPGIPAGKVVRENTSHLDLLPTLCELADLKTPAGLRGRSLLPYARGEEDPERVVVSELFHTWEPTRNTLMAKQGSLKLIDYCDGQAELFDLSTDPEEQSNLWPDHADRAAPLVEAIASLPEPFRKDHPDWKFEYTSPVRKPR
ncbi:MAG: sulfatase-like hydrolase/transferase [Puniceicoccales bacterium]